MSKNKTTGSDWYLIIGQLLAQLSDRMTSLGLIWMITEQFGEKWVTWYLVAGGLPHFLLSAWTGKLIQKTGALKTVIIADWLRAILYFFAFFVIMKVVLVQDLILVMTLIFLSNCFAAFFNPAILSVPLELEKGSEVQKLTARLSSVSSLTVVVGPILGMFCFQHFGLRGLFILNFISYLISGLCAWTLRTRITAAQDTEQTTDNKTIGLRKTLRENALVAVMLFVFLLMNLLLSPLQVQIPYLAKHIFGGSFNSLAILEVSLGGGVLMGGLILSWHSIQRKTLLATYLCLIGLCMGFLGFQLNQHLWVAVGCLLFMGIFIGLANILIINIFQSYPSLVHVPNIMSLVNSIGAAAVPFALIVVGGLQTMMTIEKISFLSGLCLFIICLFIYFPFNKFGKDLMS